MIDKLMLAIGRFFLHLIGWKPEAQRAYEQLQQSREYKLHEAETTLREPITKDGKLSV